MGTTALVMMGGREGAEAEEEALVALGWRIRYCGGGFSGQAGAGLQRGCGGGLAAGSERGDRMRVRAGTVALGLGLFRSIQAVGQVDQRDWSSVLMISTKVVVL